jgi:hypothetical protein
MQKKINNCAFAASLPCLQRAAALFFHSANGSIVNVQGSSMWPSIRNDQKVDIVYDPATLLPGTCYAFLFNDRILVHRFVCFEKGKALFIGDRSLVFEAVPPESIIGRILLKQHRSIILAITCINTLFARFPFHSQKIKLLRIFCISILTRIIR